MEFNDVISSGLLELYVLGMLSEQETAQVSVMLQKHPELITEIKAIELSMNHYAQKAGVNPGQSIKSRILAEINQPHQNQYPGNKADGQAKIVPLNNFWKYAAAAAILLLLGSIILNVIYFNKNNKLNSEYATVVQEKNKAEQDLSGLEQSNSEMENDMGVIQSKYTEPLALHGLPAAPGAAAKIFWMKNTGVVYIDPSNLPEAPNGKQYQLWAIVDGKPVDGGMLVISKNGDKIRMQKMKSFGRAEAFAVTLETEGGNPTPKGDMYVMGKL